VAIDLEFNAEEWKALTMRERIKRCLVYAEHAKLLGETAPADMREAYLDLSQHWLALAHEIETTRFGGAAAAASPS
jgi:hypothetical protein